MKKLTNRGYVLLVLAAFCAAGLALLASGFVRNGEDWATKRVNAHLYSKGSFVGAGTIYDVNGVVLARSKDSGREYNESERVRRSLLHLIGDDEGFITNCIETEYSDVLAGYSGISGIYPVIKNGKGNDVTLTVDSEVCSAAYKALGTKKGAVVVYNYKTGDVVCSVSAPGYDINDKPEDIDTDDSGQYDAVYLNRVTSGLFAPGSIFKIITLSSALENLVGVTQREFVCDGEASIGGVDVTCPSRHGNMNLEEAFASSCNCVFAQLAVEIGAERLTATAEGFGFNAPAKAGRITVTGSRLDIIGCEEGELAWAGVGQHTTLVNPMSYLLVVGAIANNGTAVNPRYVVQSELAGKVSGISGSRTYTTEEIASAVKAMMRNNVKSEYGDSRFEGLAMCGKTGTAEVGGDKRPHAWFAGFSSDEEHPYAIVVVIENGGSGAAVAIPVASAVMDAVRD